MTSAATLKHRAIEDAITTAMRGLPGRWSVYEQPPDRPVLPACVIGPGEPYRSPSTLGGFGTARERVRLVVHLLVGRNVEKPLFLANEAADAVMGAADDVAAYSTEWTSMSARGVVDVNGIEALSFTLDCDVV